MVTSLRAYVSRILAVFLKLKAVLKLKGKTKQNKYYTHKKMYSPKERVDCG